MTEDRNDRLIYQLFQIPGQHTRCEARSLNIVALLICVQLLDTRQRPRSDANRGSPTAYCQYSALYGGSTSPNLNLQAHAFRPAVQSPNSRSRKPHGHAFSPGQPLEPGRQGVAVEDGHRESEASWASVLNVLRERGLGTGPKLAIGDGALGFWKALRKTWPDVAEQRCWAHKTANVLNQLPTSMQPKVKAELQNIWMAETREAAHTAFDRTLKRFDAKYPKAMERLRKDRKALLAFYNFPAEH